MKYVPAILIVLCLAIAVFAIGFVYFITHLPTGELLTINQETARLNAETERLQAKEQYLQEYTAAKIKLQKLQNTKHAENTALYRYSLALAKSIQNLWLVWLLLSIMAIAYHQRSRFESQVDFSAEGVSTKVPAKRAETLVKEALRVVELKHSAQILSFEEDLSVKRLHENVNTIRTLKSLVKEPKETVREIETVEMSPAIPVNVPGVFSMTDLLHDPDLEPGYLPLGRNPETGMIAQAKPEYLTVIDIVGKPHHCKSTILKMLALGFLKLQDDGKELNLYVIDPHDNLPDSIGTFLKPVLHRFKSCVLGEQAIEQGKHVELLQDIETELTRRQEQGYNTPYLVILIDEIHDIFDVEPHNKETYRLLKKIRRLRKAGVMEVLTWHDSTKEGTGLGTGLMSLGVSAFVTNSTKSKASKVLESGDADKAINLEKGKSVLKIPGDDSEVICLPMIRNADLFAFLPNETPNTTNEVMAQESEQNAQNILTPESCKDAREQMGISQNKLKDLSGVSQNKIWRFENGKYEFAPEEQSAICKVLFPEKVQKIIKLDQYRKSP